MEFTGSGLRAWYGTPDAPSPSGDLPTGQAASATIGVEPSHPGNRVDVLYRINAGWERVLHATLQTDASTPTRQYFTAMFPAFASGDTVDYQPVIHCGGRRLTTPQPFPSSFRVTGEGPRPTPETLLKPLKVGTRRYGFWMEHLTCVALQLASKLEIIGNTPDGLHIDFFIASGLAEGEKLRGIFDPHGGDWMKIRTDGVGVTNIFATLKTYDGALILIEASGTADFGPDGYSRALAGKFPDTAEVVLTPRFLCSDPRYTWLNRLQCLGIGYADLRDLHVHYDFYGMHSTASTTYQDAERIGGTSWQKP